LFSLTGGGAPAASSAQDGAVASPSDTSNALAALSSLRQPSCASRPASNRETMAAARAGWRADNMGNESAHEPHQAAAAVREAERRPRLPCLRGGCAVQREQALVSSSKKKKGRAQQSKQAFPHYCVVLRCELCRGAGRQYPQIIISTWRRAHAEEKP
jgi:hypothetical protein